MRDRRTEIWILALAWTCGGLWGGEQPPGLDDAFRFRGGERVTIQVLGTEFREPLPQLVTRDGLLSAPGSGTVQVLGKTLEEATQAVRNKMISAMGMKEPQVSISIDQLPPRRVYVQGEVLKPQAIELPQDHALPLAAALAAAGGSTPEADETRVKLHRQAPGGTKEIVVVDTSRFSQPDTEDLGPILQSGDVILVPRAEVFTVTGEVKEPGVFTRRNAQVPPGEPVRLSRVVAAAGGTGPSARLEEVLVVHTSAKGEREVKSFNLRKGLEDGELEQDPELKNGDQVLVLPSDGITVLGKVRIPGIYYPPGGKITVSRLVALAGGFDLFAKQSSIVVIRKNNPQEPIRVNVRTVMEEGAVDSDLELTPGDRVFVKESAF